MCFLFVWLFFSDLCSNAYSSYLRVFPCFVRETDIRPPPFGGPERWETAPRENSAEKANATTVCVAIPLEPLQPTVPPVEPWQAFQGSRGSEESCRLRKGGREAVPGTEVVVPEQEGQPPAMGWAQAPHGVDALLDIVPRPSTGGAHRASTATPQDSGAPGGSAPVSFGGRRARAPNVQSSGLQASLGEPPVDLLRGRKRVDPRSAPNAGPAAQVGARAKQDPATP